MLKKAILISTISIYSQFSAAAICLDELQTDNAQICTPITTKNKCTMPNQLTLAINSKVPAIKIGFATSQIPADGKDYKLFLLVERTKLLTSLLKLKKPETTNTFEDHLWKLKKILITKLEIPATRLLRNARTRIAATPAIANLTKILPFNFDTATLLKQKQLSIQAALITTTDFKAAKWDKIKFSEIDTLQFITKSCPNKVRKKKLITTKLKPAKVQEFTDRKKLATEMFRSVFTHLQNGNVTVIIDKINNKWQLVPVDITKYPMNIYCLAKRKCIGGIYASIQNHNKKGEILYRIHKGKNMTISCAWKEFYSEPFKTMSEQLKKDALERAWHWGKVCFKA
jgi:hypothetical protein